MATKLNSNSVDKVELSSMHSALIIDDEADARGVLRHLLKMFCPSITKIAEAQDSEEAMSLASRQPFDLAFIDIQLKEESGITLAQNLINYCPNLIFVTAHDNYAVEAYKTDAIHYLLKPVNPNQLQQAVDRANLVNSTKVVKDRVLLPTKNGIVILYQTEIIRVQGDGNYCSFVCKDGKEYFVSKNLAHYETLLDPQQFFRIHQSHLVNIEAVREFLIDNGYYVVMNNEDRLPIARRRKDDFLRALHH